MNRVIHQITVNDVVIEVVRKKIKNLNLRVYPPDGRVRVAVPHRVAEEEIRRFTISKLDWIKRQQARFRALEPPPIRAFVSGESVYYLGHRYQLNVIYHDAPPRVVLVDDRLDLMVRPGSDVAQREQVLQNWNRRQLKLLIPPLIHKWEAIVEVQVAAWGVKQMQTRWGSCNTQARRIWLNLALLEKPPHCLEYIIVHELVHLLERLHNERFKAYMTTFMPQWRQYRRELNQHSPGQNKVED